MVPAEENVPAHRLISCVCLFGYLVLAASGSYLYAQDKLPPGTVIPVILQTSIDSQKSTSGRSIVAQVAQDVPLEKKVVIPRRTKVLGEIVQLEANSNPVMVALRFDRIEVHHRELPIALQLRAIASPLEISSAQMAMSAPNDAGRNSPATRTTIQVGGDVVYRGGGPVQSRTGEIVGTPTPCVTKDQCGVLVKVKSDPGPNCAGATADETHPQALWLFSSDACGVYGFSELQFQNGSAISRDGQVLFSSSKRIKLPGGAGLLLTVTGISADAPRP